jgi:hypothetical protein
MSVDTLKALLDAVLPSQPYLQRIEVTQQQYDTLKAQAQAETRTYQSPFPIPSTMLGIPVVIVDEPLTIPRLVYRPGHDGR